MGGISLEETLLFHLLLQRLTHVFVFVLEDGTPKAFDLGDHVPRLLVRDALHDIFEDPLQQHVSSAQVGYQLIYRQLFHLLVVEAYLQICRQVELPCHVPQHTLEEGVDGLHAEVVVVVQQVVEPLSGPFPDGLRGIARLFFYDLQVAVRFGQRLPDTV